MILENEKTLGTSPGWIVGSRRPADQKKKALSYEIAKWRTVTAYEKILDSLQWNHQVDETSDNRIST